MFDFSLGDAGALFLDEVAAVELDQLEFAVVHALQEGGKLGVAVVSDVEVGEALGQEVAYPGQADGLVDAVVFHQQLGDGSLDLVDAGDGFLDGGDVGRVFLDGDHGAAALDVLNDLGGILGGDDL